MNRRHAKLLGKTRADDADVRGEHDYPDERPPGTDTVLEDALKRDHYAAGADGTQMVPEPEGAALPEEEQ
jgi:hypothetical protein